MRLRPYQLQAIEGVESALTESPSSLVVMPTGTGKTVCFASLIQRWTGRTMVLAHREELIRQAAEKVSSITGDEPDIEMGDDRADLNPFRRSKAIISTIQTQIAGKPPRMERFDPSQFGHIITDEAHHAPSKSYRRVYEHYLKNPQAKHVGFTATPDRSDEKAMGKVFDNVAYCYELSDAIRDGWLCDIILRPVYVTGLDYSTVGEVGGDLNQADVARQQGSEKVLRGMIVPMMEMAKGRRTLIFATPGYNGRVHEDEYHVATRMEEILNELQPGCCKRVSVETTKVERRQILAGHAAGEFPYLLNVGVLTEGYDDPGIEVVAITRPTKSRALYAQMVGRGTRPLPGLVDGLASPGERRASIYGSSKPNVEVLDFRGNCGRHSLAGVADILGGKYDDEVVERASKQDGSILEALDEAQKKLDEERERRRRIPLTCKVTYLFQTVNPFEVLNINPPVLRGWDMGRGPTERQKQALIANGVVVTPEMRMREAKHLLDDINRRRREGLVGYRQSVELRAKGLPTDVTPGEALNMLRGIRNGRS